MKKLTALSVVMFVAGACLGGGLIKAEEVQVREQPTTLGAFSVSLTVKNIQASQAFYEKLDFVAVMGDAKQNWLILRNGMVTIGLFQGALQRNTLTFNPGWDSQAQPVGKFTDVREHQRRLKSKGLKLTSEADEKGTGPAGFLLIDPDGNPVLIDQHVK